MLLRSSFWMVCWAWGQNPYPPSPRVIEAVRAAAGGNAAGTLIGPGQTASVGAGGSSIGAPRLATVGGVEVVARSHSGVFTQPLSFIGLPVISVPVAGPGALPLGVQVVAAPFREAVLFRVAARLEADGVVSARPVP